MRVLVWITALFAAALFAAPAAAQAGDDSNLTYTDDADGRVEAAMQTARNSLPHFWSRMAEDNDTLGGFSLKVAMPTYSDSFEHIWVDTIVRGDGETITAKLANVPVDIIGDPQLGDEVRFEKEDISDWAYWEGNKMRGHFSTRALFPEMPPETAAEVRAILHEDPLP